MVQIYRPPRPPQPVAAPAPEQAPAPAPAEAPPPTPRPLSRDVFTLRLMRLFPVNGGLDAARKMDTEDHQQVRSLGEEIMHPDPIAGAARLSVWLQFGRGFPLPQPDQTLLDKLAETWLCADPQPIERNGRAAFLTMQEMGLPLAGDEPPDMPDPLDLLSSPTPKPPGQGPDSVGKTPPPPASASAPYEVDREAPPVVVPSRSAYKFYGRQDELTNADLNSISIDHDDDEVQAWNP